MREIFTLTKLFVSSSLGLSAIKHQLFKNKKELWKPVVLFLVVLSFLPIYIGYIHLLENIYVQLFELGQENALFTLVIVPISLMILFFGIVYAMSALYFSKDIEQLIPLPIHASKIVIGKFICMLVYEYVLIIPFILPVFIVAYQDFGGILYVIYSVLTVLLLPTIPLGVGTISVMLLMKYTNIQGKKDLVRSISLFLMVFAIIGIQVLLTKTLSSVPIGSEARFLSELLEKGDAMMGIIGKAYPPAIWFSKSLALSGNIMGFIYMIFTISISILMIYIIGSLGSRVYLKTLLERNNFKRNNKAVSIEKLVSRPQYIAVFINDLRLTMRTPIFLFNCVSISLILPILIVVMPLISGTGDDIDFRALYLTYGDYFNLVLIAIFAFIAAANPTASTTYSREGKSNWITNIMPVSHTQIFIGRIIQPLLIELIAISLMLSALIFVVPLSISEILTSLVLGMLVSLPIISVGIVIDLLNPKLDWEQPQQAVKQNINVIINMIIGVGYIVMAGYLSMQMMEIYIHVNFIYVFIATISILFTGGFFVFFRKAAKKEG